jgi:outer membrane protein assembly factor BamB
MAALCVLSGWAVGGDWPRFLGPTANGFAPDKGINKDWAAKPPAVLWKIQLTDGYAGPSAAGGKVYIVDHRGKDDVVRAMDLASGKALWENTCDAGKEPAYCTPAIDEGKVFTVSRQGLVHCLDASKGDKVWSVDLVETYGSVPPQWQHAWSPVVDGQALLLTAGGPEAVVVALDKATGKLLWKGGGTDGAGYAPVVVASIGGKKRYMVSALTSIRSVDETGALQWTFTWQNTWKVNAPTPIVAQDLVFVTSGYGKGCALLDGATGKALWQNGEIASHFSTPVLHEGFLYSTTDPGRLVCMEMKTGQVKWTQRGFEKGGLCAVDGTLIVLDGKKGDITQVAISPESYKELGRVSAPLGGQSWTAPIVTNGKLIVRNKQQMVCLDLM